MVEQPCAADDVICWAASVHLTAVLQPADSTRSGRVPAGCTSTPLSLYRAAPFLGSAS